VRSGPWKLIEFFEDGHLELYNLADDPLEARDQAKAQPAKVNELKTKLEAWRKKVGAQLPTPNPDYDAEKDKAQDKKGGKKKEA